MCIGGHLEEIIKNKGTKMIYMYMNYKFIVIWIIFYAAFYMGKHIYSP